ncbi:MAG: NlpC/P60 family protein [bacterium]|nr:NlpC/P60 family protein [bacterium]
MKNFLRPLVGVAQYRRGAGMSDLEKLVVNCWTLVKWAYKQCGFQLPDFPTEQREFLSENGEELTLQDVDVAGAVVFVHSRLPKYLHVGIATGEGTVIHATNRRETQSLAGSGGVFEVPIDDFVSERTFRGAYLIRR